MPLGDVAELSGILQASVSPVILISGIALLLLSMTNRLARTVDRARELSHEMRRDPSLNRPLFSGQLQILHRRSHLQRSAITFASISILCLSLLVVLLFLSYLLRWGGELLLIAIFGASFLFLIAALGLFIYDLMISLRALDLEIRDQLRS